MLCLDQESIISINGDIIAIFTIDKDDLKCIDEEDMKYIRQAAYVWYKGW